MKSPVEHSRSAPRAPFTPTEPFQPALGLASPHAQTLVGVMLRAGAPLPLERERWELADGDFVDVDWLPAPPSAPHVLVLHGLEGSSRSGYVAVVMRLARERGWGAAALNFRSCSGEPNRLLRSYHSGETEDARYALERLQERVQGPLFGVGFSLGGNVMVKLLAELGEGSPLRAGAAVSVPYDLARCAEALDRNTGLGAVYRWVFLRSLKAKTRAKAERHPGQLDLERLRRVRGIVDFDDAVTAQLHGFGSAAEYYRRSSSGPLIGRIRRPTLLVTAVDDPMVPGGSIPEDAEKNPYLSWLVTQHGGHVGFLAGSLLRPRFWAEEQVIAFFAGQL